MTLSLVRPLFDGAIDIVADVHGEIDALDTLLTRLGYDSEGRHPEGRRLVFVGDLVDRGPDSPAVVELVRRLVEEDRAQCVLGNHELNILIHSLKPDNFWFYQELPPNRSPPHRPEARADGRSRETILRFFRSLPLALERADVRVVHACWDDRMIESVRQAARADQIHDEFRTRIEGELRCHPPHAPQDAEVIRQNENPVKLLTSGPEEKADEPFEVMGQLRHERRVVWWQRYEGPLCVFGHYWRILLPGEVDNDRLFPNVPLNARLGRGDAMCIDYSVGKRFMERSAPGFPGTFHTRLAALRLPERVLIFDHGEQLPLLRG